jgi:hypothetical protein
MLVQASAHMPIRFSGKLIPNVGAISEQEPALMFWLIPGLQLFHMGFHITHEQFIPKHKRPI